MARGTRDVLARSARWAAALVVVAASGGAVAQTRDANLWRAMETLASPNLAAAEPGAAAPMSTGAPNAIAIDATTGRILGVKSADRAIPPASMTKLMTALMVFEAIDRGELRLDERIAVSARAAAAPGSTMGLVPGDTPTVDELLSGLIVASGNDAAIALAEALAGSEAEFARRMTMRAQALGFDSARFQNATGLPAEGHRISVADLARLSTRLIVEHEEHLGYFDDQSMSWRGTRWWNRNPTLSLDLRDLGARADGLKTGHTRAAGFCVAASAIVQTENGPRRVVVVLAGLPSEAARARESEAALRWAIERVAQD